MDILTDVINRVQLSGTLLFHYELGRPWNVALPQTPDAVFHYLRHGSATVVLEEGREIRIKDGDFILIARGEPHIVRSGRRTKPLSLFELERRPAHLGVVRHGGDGEPVSTLICGYFMLARPTRMNPLQMLPSILHLRPDHDWLEAILQRIVDESAIQRPGQCAVLARITEVLFVEVLRSWAKSLGFRKSGWLGALADPQIGKALQLIHEHPGRRWSLRELGRCAGLSRTSFVDRFTKLVGQPVHSYLVSRRMDEAALLLISTDEAIARIATSVGYGTRAAFSKVFQKHFGTSPGRYRSLGRRGRFRDHRRIAQQMHKVPVQKNRP
ncbi:MULTISPECIES: AraC family transcriptional regulator [Bradyrhizobium]|uniref:AraC family transcriptional regulator n=1 Tax=Bradyrhizobium canariense TaxID=255045 RepID=A0A1X3GSU3_9BRAD|nr:MULTISPECIES: AraC family transcriptional regulator [Bradyrhizobium]OSI71563.1 AraC family transcriptional regulator [Bradyrhizobium canariense]OSI80526.1 AraC family transcriptional regulator [Bradyrhizobium canariense]OSI91128.1 AraC family transcriptional regulator [Bradyrhizobium canariense]OSI96740.1 AraC family transcriptional regulator [Bradyrhizobium canariense]OSJ12974.1 AraC family transcriptional regulator [Bradyrhizobium canariense]